MTASSISHKNLMNFSRMLDDTTNSYKIIFLQSLINLIEEFSCHERVVISLRELAVEMAVIAWYPHKFFRLSLGVQDQLSSILDRIDTSSNDLGNKSFAKKDDVRSLIDIQYERIGLKSVLKYVPYRLLTPFLESELRGRKDSEKNSLIEHLSSELYNTSEPSLYRFIKGVDGLIEVHPLWVNYIANTLPFIKGWIKSSWVQYLQARNKNIPAVVYKAYMPLSRASLSKQRSYWSIYMESHDVRCIYSNDIVPHDNFALDHFVPWSFVCHDQIWNLIPVEMSVNSSKGNCLPAKKYLNKFVDQQLDLLAHFRRFNNKQSPNLIWNRCKESYILDFGLKEAELESNDTVIHSKLSGALDRMLLLAAQSGFTPDWEFTLRSR